MLLSGDIVIVIVVVMMKRKSWTIRGNLEV